MERWKPVVGYETTYEVSDQGSVRRLPGTAYSPRGVRRLRIVPPHVMRRATVAGYHVVNLCMNGIVKARKVHSLVAEAFIGPRPAGLAINHKDGDKVNNTPANLEYVSTAANNRHALEVCRKRDRMLKGEASPVSKLTDDRVRAIRALHHAGITPTQLAERFGVSRANIRWVVSRATWQHIE